MATIALETMTLRLSEIYQAILAMVPTGVAVFCWGPPGIAKSAVSQQAATSLGRAFVDIRLSQMDPTDLRGIPYPVFALGRHGISWSSPWALPRDIAISERFETGSYAETIVVDLSVLNPTGSNGIHYCTTLDVAVTSLTAGLTAKVVSQTLDKVEIGLFDADGTLAVGAARLTVTGQAQAIVGMEEFNSAPQSVQAAAYQLVLDHRLGEYVAPKGVYFMAMGNRDTDKGITYKMGTPLMNRFVHIEMRPDFADWQVWALTAGAHEHVVGFLTAFTQHLFEFNPGSAARGFATPRSWEFVSKILHNNQAATVSETVMTGLIMGAVGDGVGVQFMTFRNHATALPSADSILDGSLTTVAEKLEVSLCFALIISLSYKLRERADAVRRNNGADWEKSKARTAWLKSADHFLAFMMNNFTPEIVVMGARNAIAVHALPFSPARMTQFTVFTERFKSLLMTSS